jgi:hypothetical protein
VHTQESPGALDSPLLLDSAVAALQQMHRLISKPTELSFDLNAALAASAVPATLAAWAAAALRAGRRAAVARVQGSLDYLLQAAWIQTSFMLEEADAGTASTLAGALQDLPGVGEEELTVLPGGPIICKAGAWGAEDYERLAKEIMPKVDNVAGSVSGAQERARLGSLAEARALATRPCANPRCMRIVGCRERDARGKLCIGCKVVRYCCRECQVAGWRAHKGVCKELAAEREAAA